MNYCRGCGAELDRGAVFADLGAAPLANALLSQDRLDKPEVHHPLRAIVCRKCLLVQLWTRPDAESIFTDTYAFYSGIGTTWLGHCKSFAHAIAERLKLSPLSHVLEIGSNDGAMLACFRGLGIPAMGVEPCAGVARVALREGLATDIAPWSEAYARGLRDQRYKADLVIANNVLAHVEDLRDFLRGVRTVLAPGGVATFEFPWVRNLIDECQWDQIYHEHLCYFSLRSLQAALQCVDLHAVDVEPLAVHGGSLRVHVQKAGMGTVNEPRINEVLAQEAASGLDKLDTYLAFAAEPARAKRRIWQELASRADECIVGYGASAKASSLLHQCGIGPETIEFVADITPAKWGKYLPGSRIPIKGQTQLVEAQPGVVVNFLWNWRTEAERRIRQACPDAEIVYLHRSEVAA